VCSRFIEQILEQGRIPSWHCHQSNSGSKILAEKLGFQVSNEYLYMSPQWKT
jgi:predicted GNAT family acetyltransferase